MNLLLGFQVYGESSFNFNSTPNVLEDSAVNNKLIILPKQYQDFRKAFLMGYCLTVLFLLCCIEPLHEESCTWKGRHRMCVHTSRWRQRNSQTDRDRDWQVFSVTYVHALRLFPLNWIRSLAMAAGCWLLVCGWKRSCCFAILRELLAEL